MHKKRLQNVTDTVDYQIKNLEDYLTTF